MQSVVFWLRISFGILLLYLSQIGSGNMYYYVFNADELRHSVIYLSQIRSDNLLVYLSLNSSHILLLYI